MSLDLTNVIVSFAVGTVGAGFASAIIKKRFDSEFDIWKVQRDWKRDSVTQLLGPVYAQLMRSSAAFDRWVAQGRNTFIETEVIKTANQTIRDLLLTKSHLVPPDLREDAQKLVLHYDVWLEEFARVRTDHTEGDGPRFVFVGPKGYPFPREADLHFRKVFEEYWRDLYQKI